MGLLCVNSVQYCGLCAFYDDTNSGYRYDKCCNTSDVQRIELQCAETGTYLASGQDGDCQRKNIIPGKRWNRGGLPSQCAHGIYEDEDTGQSRHLARFSPAKEMKQWR